MDVRCAAVLAALFVIGAGGADVPPHQALSSAQQDQTQPPASPQTGPPASSASASPGFSDDSKEKSRLAIIRYVDQEYAKAVLPIPGGKHGYKLEVGKPPNASALATATRLQGQVARPGDTVQITKLEFREKEIYIEINGGPRKHFHLMDHLSLGVGDVPDPQPREHPGEGVGAILILDYGGRLPDLSPDDIKRDLSPFLEFSKQSAAVNWLDALPPEFQQGIKDHRAVVGMDQDMVVAALGRPDRKVRERDANGNETEEWIYGDPPARTVFVKFSGDKVISVEVFG